MTTLGDFRLDAEVFFASSVNDWLAVRIVGPESDNGTIPLEVVWTGGIPGFEVGQRIDMSPTIPAWETLTVGVVTAHAQHATTGGSMPVCVADSGDGSLDLIEGSQITGPTIGRVWWDDTADVPGYVLRIKEREQFPDNAEEVVQALANSGYLLDDVSLREVAALAES